MVKRLATLVSLLGLAEVTASWLIWARSPSDSLRVWYSGFWAFEVGRLRYWVPVFASVVTVWILAWYFIRPLTAAKHNVQGNHQRLRLTPSRVLGASLAIGLEVLASWFYWSSPRSFDLRTLYQSGWYWHANGDLYWSSFLGYLVWHFVPWTAVIALGLTLSHFWNRRVARR
jgi:hypothetical protein